MAAVNMKWKSIRYLVVALLILLVFNEVLVYYLVLLQCQWPLLPLEKVRPEDNHNILKVMILADVHLLGSREGHWFDKLRREWQIERSFQASMLIHSPDVVFVLGDLFDEGKWCSDSEFQYYVRRFNKKFATPSKTMLYVVAGNHDMGFHYMINDHKLSRFSTQFSAPSVRMVNVKNNIFILINSMALEGDRCSMCKEAERQLKTIQDSLLCAQGLKSQCSKELFQYSRPIIMQHFPLYRESDSNCSGPDSAPDNEKYILMKPKWDCLDKVISQELLSTLKPRLVFSGHTHHFCITHHNSTPEWTVPSFSWRYKKIPSFLLMSLTPDVHSVSKCYLPRETTVVYTYLIGGILIVVCFILFSQRFRVQKKI